MNKRFSNFVLGLSALLSISAAYAEYPTPPAYMANKPYHLGLSCPNKGMGVNMAVCATKASCSGTSCMAETPILSGSGATEGSDFANFLSECYGINGNDTYSMAFVDQTVQAANPNYQYAKVYIYKNGLVEDVFTSAVYDVLSDSISGEYIISMPTLDNGTIGDFFYDGMSTNVIKGNLSLGGMEDSVCGQ